MKGGKALSTSKMMQTVSSSKKAQMKAKQITQSGENNQQVMSPTSHEA